MSTSENLFEAREKCVSEQSCSCCTVVINDTYLDFIWAIYFVC